MKVGLLYFLVTFLLLCPHASSLSDEGIHRSFLPVFVLVKIFNSIFELCDSPCEECDFWLFLLLITL